MRPFLFYLGTTGVPSFFFMIMIGALAATFFASHMAKKEGADPIVLLDFGIVAIVASVLGSRIFHILVENPAYYWEHPIRVFYFWQGGFVSIGAFLASAISWIVYLRVRKLDAFRYFDLACTGVPLIDFSVRVGCLLVGCCYGKPTDFWIHLVFNNPQSTAGYYHLGEKLHATQLYFMLNALVMWGVLLLVYKYRKFKGQVLCSFLIYYGVSRFFIEFLRGDADRGMWFDGMVSTGQISMIGSMILGLLLWGYLSRKNKTGITSDS